MAISKQQVTSCIRISKYFWSVFGGQIFGCEFS